jgi:hypothetical protein
MHVHTQASMPTGVSASYREEALMDVDGVGVRCQVDHLPVLCLTQPRVGGYLQQERLKLLVCDVAFAAGQQLQLTAWALN